MQNSDCVVGFCIKVGSSEPSFTIRNVLFPLLITPLLDFIRFLLMSTTFSFKTLFDLEIKIKLLWKLKIIAICSGTNHLDYSLVSTLVVCTSLNNTLPKLLASTIHRPLHVHFFPVK